MVWQNGGTGSHIPQPVKRQVLQRDHHTCQLAYPHRCIGTLTPNTAQYDHITPVHQLPITRDQANDPDNLRAVCEPCHRHHSSLQGHAAKRARRYRKPQTHPGLER